MSILSAGTSNTTSLIYTGDTTGDMVFQTNGTTEAMRITAAQNVGIGTNAPTVKLDVVGSLKVTNSSGSSIVANRSSNPGSVEIQHSGTQTAQLSAVSGGGLEFYQGSSPTLVMKYDSAGRVTMPSQPAFHAVSTSIKEITGSPFIFDTVFFNTGGHYNASNGRFTAPIAGIYYLQMDFLTTNSNTNTVDLRFFKNGAQTQLGTAYYTNYTGGDHRKGFMIALASLNANDYITVQTQSGGSNGNLYGDTNDVGGKGHTAFRAFLMG